MQILDAIRDAVRVGSEALFDPGANPIVALVALAVVVLTLLVVLLVVYVIVLSFESRGRPTVEQATPVKRQRTGRKRIFAVAFLVVLAGAFGYGWTYSASDEACARCHYNAAAFDSRDAGTHPDVACRTCHIGPGADAAVLQRLRGAENLVTHVMGEPSDVVRAEVPNGACLQCHEQILDGVVVARSVSMRHSDVLDAGYSCLDCHNTEGHGKRVAKAQYPTMSQCIVCHDDIAVSADCALCHSEDVGVAVRRPARPYAQTYTERQDCRGCHSMGPCIECHGLELPHSQEFVDGYHARPALLKTAMCMECHSIGDCNVQCHSFLTNDRTGATWKPQHASVGPFVSWHANATPVGLGSCSCHDTDRERFCNYCHGPQPDR